MCIVRRLVSCPSFWPWEWRSGLPPESDGLHLCCLDPYPLCSPPAWDSVLGSTWPCLPLTCSQ